MIKSELVAPDVLKTVALESLKSDDFAGLAQQVETVMKTQGKISLLIDAPHLEGWENLAVLKAHAAFVKALSRRSSASPSSHSTNGRIGSSARSRSSCTQRSGCSTRATPAWRSDGSQIERDMPRPACLRQIHCRKAAMGEAIVIVNAGSTSLKFAAYPAAAAGSPHLLCGGQINGMRGDPHSVVRDAANAAGGPRNARRPRVGLGHSYELRTDDRQHTLALVRP